MKEKTKPTADKQKQEKKGGVALVKNPQQEREKKDAKRNSKDLSPDVKTVTGDMNMGL